MADVSNMGKEPTVDLFTYAGKAAGLGFDGHRVPTSGSPAQLQVELASAIRNFA